MTAEQKATLADIALGLRNEQLEARIVHYKGNLETSPELDAITAQVVAEFQAFQQRAVSDRPAESAEAVEKQLTATLERLLLRVFRPGEPSVIVERKVVEVGRRLARLFFESQLHEKISGTEQTAKTIEHAEQGLLYVLTRHDRRLRAELEAFSYADDEVRERTFDMLTKLSKDLRMGFLSRRSKELERLMKLFQKMLIEFLHRALPPEVPQIAAATVREAKLGTIQQYSYKVERKSFPAFRQAFEASFLVRLIDFAEERLLPPIAQGDFHPETRGLVTDPQLFSDVCELLCGGLYEYLYGEGFLDLPADWKQELGRG
jgi:hypothetical protein